MPPRHAPATSKSSSSSSAGPPTKRRRTTRAAPGMGAPSEDDQAQTSVAQTANPSSSAFSTRSLPLRPENIPSLSTLCARVFVAHAVRLLSEESAGDATKEWLKLLPDEMIPKLLAMLRSSLPVGATLQYEVLIANFLRGSTVKITSDLFTDGKVKYAVGGAIRTHRDTPFVHLEVSDFPKLSDSTCAALVSRLPSSLRALTLRGCTQIGVKTAETVANNLSNLTTLNINYTSVPPIALASVIIKYADTLEVLKLAGISNWTDATFLKLLASLKQANVNTLPSLRTLKLRHLNLSDASLFDFLTSFPSLTRLDVSFTPIKHLPPLPASLEKLLITSTQISASNLVERLSGLPELKRIDMGALGAGTGTSATLGASALTLWDADLKEVRRVLGGKVEEVSLVGNAKLGRGEGRGVVGKTELGRFVNTVGRRCKRLNLANITQLRSEDFEGLTEVGEEENRDGTAAIEELILNNTGVRDDAAPYIAAGCPRLRVLEVAGTRFTSEGLFRIIDRCERLEKVDVTSCRGVRVQDRRRLFEAWKEWKDAQV